MEKSINVPKKYINLSGLELLRQRIGLTSEPPIFKTMCMKITKAEKGYVELEAYQITIISILWELFKAGLLQAF